MTREYLHSCILPNELLIPIFEQLDLLEWYNLSLVSKHFNTLACQQLYRNFGNPKAIACLHEYFESIFIVDETQFNTYRQPVQDSIRNLDLSNLRIAEAYDDYAFKFVSRERLP